MAAASLKCLEHITGRNSNLTNKGATMLIVTNDGNRYVASQISKGEKEWCMGGEQGLWFWCTSAMIWVPLSNIAHIEYR